MCVLKGILIMRQGPRVRVHFSMSSLNIFKGVLYKGTVVPGDVRSEREADNPPEGTFLLQSPRPLHAPSLEEQKAEFLFLSLSFLL